MKRLFGKKKEAAPPPPDITETTNMMEKRSDHITSEIEKINTQLAQIQRDLKNPANKARQATLKRQAINLLKRRKMYETQQNTIEGQRFNLEQIQFAQDQMKLNMQTVQAMKATNDVMKKQYKNFNISDVDDTILDMEDMYDDANEISNILAQGVGDNYDQDELEAEFDALNFDDIADETVTTGADLYNPGYPQFNQESAAPPVFNPGQNNKF